MEGAKLDMTITEREIRHNINSIQNNENDLALLKYNYKKIRQEIDQMKKDSLEIHQQYAMLISSSFQYSNVEDKETQEKRIDDKITQILQKMSPLMKELTPSHSIVRGTSFLVLTHPFQTQLQIS